MAIVADKVEQVPLSTKIGGQFQIAKDQGIMTDAVVSANSTVTALKAALLTPLASDGAEKVKTQHALTKSVEMGLIAETHTATTVAELVAFTDSASGEKAGFFN